MGAFIRLRFPTILVLNKIDHPDSDKNIQRIMKAYPSVNDASLILKERCVVTSALAELMLRKLAREEMIIYQPGSTAFPPHSL